MIRGDIRSVRRVRWRMFSWTWRKSIVSLGVSKKMYYNESWRLNKAVSALKRPCAMESGIVKTKQWSIWTGADLARLAGADLHWLWIRWFDWWRGVDFEALELLERQSYIQLKEGGYRGRVNKVSEYSIEPISRAIQWLSFLECEHPLYNL